ncbi:MAG TPA: ABC transporter ATP-binding protein [Polyangiaceae bacterium]|jgi:ABC-2 type transport system ATP-binding protein|nr:ABC transporter ATP-binding protein [Polyangiaceae bacterium]
MSFVEVQSVSKRFAERVALKEVSFAVEAGSIFGLLGPNAAGKSTLLSMICGLLPPDSGSVRIGDCPATRWPRAQIGVVGQQVAVYQDLTVRENLEFFAELCGLERARRRQAVARELHNLGLEERSATLARELSGGMQRRLHIASALVHDPPLLILDEPSVGLDLESRDAIWSAFRALGAQGRTLFITTHQLEEAEELCDRIGVLIAGRLRRVGTPSALREALGVVEVAHVQASNLERVTEIATSLHYQTRRRETGVDVWLPKMLELHELAGQFASAQITSLSRRPVRLQDAYLEILHEAKSPES